MHKVIANKSIFLSIVFVFILAACAPDDLDITPTPTATLVPTAAPTATPLSQADLDLQNANQEVLSVYLDNLPAQIPAGSVQWRRDLSRGANGIDPIPRAENGSGAKAYYTEQTGGQMNLTFAVFDTPADAAAHYEFIQGLRQPLETGDTDDSFPQPNIFGSGLYGSVAIFQVEETFIEVNIELFSSTQGNPLVPLARATINYFEETQATIGDVQSSSAGDAETVGSGDGDMHPLLAAFLEEMPTEILGDAIWNRDMERNDGLEIPSNFGDGDVIRVFYGEQTGGAMQWTIATYDTPEGAAEQYERFTGIRDSTEDQNSREGFPEPHLFGQGLYGSVAIFQIDETFVEILIERAPGTVANPLESIARRVLTTLDAAKASIA